MQQQHRFAAAEVDRIALRHGADSKGDTGGIASRDAHRETAVVAPFSPKSVINCSLGVD
jgi:hypothetical protein